MMKDNGQTEDKGKISYLEKKVEELSHQIEIMEREKEEIIENFQISTNVLLDKIKDLESASIGSRPQTSMILKKLGILP